MLSADFRGIFVYSAFSVICRKFFFMSIQCNKQTFCMLALDLSNFVTVYGKW